MAHPLKTIMQEQEPVLVIGDSAAGRFPAFSYNAYTKTGKAFYCLDLGGLTVSRGGTAGGKVYTQASELPADRGDLALIWVKPKAATKAVDVAHEAGCKRVWFSFSTGHRDAVARARELGMEVVEIGRCPVLYLDGAPLACAAHTAGMKVTGGYKKAPQTDPGAKRREMW